MTENLTPLQAQARDLDNACSMLVGIVRVDQGIKGVSLVTKYMLMTEDFVWANTEGVGPLVALDECLRRGLIKEIEYVLPHMNYRVKSMYFTTDVEIRIPNNNEEAEN